MDRVKCNYCAIEKDITDFYKDKTKKSGFRKICKNCVSQNAKEYRSNEQTKEMLRINQQRYNQQPERQAKLIEQRKQIIHCDKCNIDITRGGIHKHNKSIAHIYGRDVVIYRISNKNGVTIEKYATPTDNYYEQLKKFNDFDTIKLPLNEYFEQSL